GAGGRGAVPGGGGTRAGGGGGEAVKDPAQPPAPAGDPRGGPARHFGGDVVPGRSSWSARATSCQLSPKTRELSSACTRGSRYQDEGIDRARSSGKPESNAPRSSSSEVSTPPGRLTPAASGPQRESGPWQDAPPVPAAGRPARDVDTAAPAPTLVRSLGALDGALITIGATVGSGIFLTTGEIARRLPHPGLILALWAAGGLFALAGALA